MSPPRPRPRVWWCASVLAAVILAAAIAAYRPPSSVPKANERFFVEEQLPSPEGTTIAARAAMSAFLKDRVIPERA
jgi:hypothetical protein